MKKLMALSAVAVSLLQFNVSVAITAPQPFTAFDTEHHKVTLYQATTPHHSYLLENAEPNRRYLIIEATHNPFNSEDNEIILVRG